MCKALSNPVKDTRSVAFLGGREVLRNHPILEIIPKSSFTAEFRVGKDVLLPILQEAKLRFWRQMVEMRLESTNM